MKRQDVTRAVKQVYDVPAKGTDNAHKNKLQPSKVLPGLPQINSFADIACSTAPRIAEMHPAQTMQYIYERLEKLIVNLYTLQIPNLLTFEFQLKEFARDTVQNCKHLRLNEIDHMILYFPKIKQVHRIDVNVLYYLRKEYLKIRSNRVNQMIIQQKQKKSRKVFSGKEITAAVFYGEYAIRFMLHYSKLFGV